ncbi:phage holin family protein [Devosia sp. A16]|uniref:phage holin family protein n=1 Tax=Devosia sp. A16 TaxID=1736675 RepID=UPI001F26918C|nr:phage holin family protein [Devosia sp. A16]
MTDLLGSLAGDISGLFRKEVQLAKAEASEKLDDALAASKGLAIGAVLAIGAIGVFLAALVTGLSWLLMALGMSETAADFVAAIAVALVVGGIAWSFISKSLEAWKASRLNLNRTTNSLARDAEVVKESF